MPSFFSEASPIAKDALFPKESSGLNVDQTLEVVIADQKFLLQSLRKIGQEKSQTLHNIEKELHRLTSAFEQFAAFLIEVKPNIILVLDKGARVFYEGVQSMVAELFEPGSVHIATYNDQKLKIAFQASTLDREQQMTTTAQSQLGHFAGQKILFLDEVYSAGKGASALIQATSIIGADGYYFALSKFNDYFNQMQHTSYSKYDWYPEVARIVTEAQAEGRIKVAHVVHQDIFLPEFSRSIVTETETGEVIPVNPKDQFKNVRFENEADAVNYIAECIRIETTYTSLVNQAVRDCMSAAAQTIKKRGG